MEHRCSEHAEVYDESFKLIDGHVRGEVQARCQICGSELRYEYILDKVVDTETEEVDYISC
jgi:hypothetical protein